MNKELIVNTHSNGLDIALLEDNVLVELHQEKSDKSFSVGDIFIGKVKKTVPGLNAAFVDIGYEKDAFLHYTDLSPQVLSLKKYVKQVLNKQEIFSLSNFDLEKEINRNGKISDVLFKNDLLLVQILKEPISGKGPRLSCEITLPGHYVVLAPFTDVVAVSRKIKSKEERKRLQKIVEGIKPVKFGLIVRTDAEDRKVVEIHEDIKRQLERWEKMSRHIAQVIPPEKVMSDEGATSGILNELIKDEVQKITVNDKQLAENIQNSIRTTHPGHEKIVKVYKKQLPIFDHFKITKQIKSSFGKAVSMRSGADIVIEATEAMYVIDVNSGHKMSTKTNQEASALSVNLEAASEIARQLRLRDVGGLIVIDFIDMKENENKQMVYRRMKEEMKEDRARHTILPLSKFNLMQITRERMRPAIEIDVEETCPTCRGTGKAKPSILVVDEIKNNLSYFLRELDYKNLKLVVHPFIEAFIKKGVNSEQMRWFWKHKKWVTVSSDDNYFLSEYHFFDKDNEEIKL